MGLKSGFGSGGSNKSLSSESTGVDTGPKTGLGAKLTGSGNEIGASPTTGAATGGASNKFSLPPEFQKMLQEAIFSSIDNFNKQQEQKKQGPTGGLTPPPDNSNAQAPVTTLASSIRRKIDLNPSSVGQGVSYSRIF